MMTRFGKALLRPAAALWLGLLVSLVGYQLVFGLQLVTAGDRFWSNPPGDMGQMLAGELAGLRAPWSLPILTPDTLLAPDRVSLVYTDSIPWLTALLKLTHLGRTFSLLGTFLLLSWLAQPAAMYAVLRACGVRRASTLLAGGLLALLTPAWLGRQLGHIALSGHALQLLALALAVQAIRKGLTTRAATAFAALGVLATGIHAYHVPVVGLMLVAAVVSEVAQRRPGALARSAAALGGFLVASGLAAWALGYFVGRGGSGGADALGFYEMNIVAPIWPQASALAGQRWTGGWFTGTFDPTGGEYYEGFDYLGAGVLLLLASAAVAAWVARRRRGERAPAPTPPSSSLRRWGPLAVGLAFLAIYAVGTKPYLGPLRLFAAPLPHAAWMEPLALFRCHGRFFWLVGYALIAWALTTLEGMRPRRLHVPLLAAAVVLQAADMSQMLYGLHDIFGRTEPLRVPQALVGPAFHGRDYRFYPGYYCTASVLNHVVVRQLSLIAQRQQASTSSAETARAPLGGCSPPPPADALVDAAPGDRRITVLMSEDGAPSPVTGLFSRRSDCASVASFWLCGRDLAGLPGATPVSGASLVDTARVDAVLELGSPAFVAALKQGWGKPEASGVWSIGRRAIICLARPTASRGSALRVSLQALGYQPEGRAAQRAYVSVNGRRLAEWRLDGGGYHGLAASIPAELVAPGSPLDVVIDLPDALSPNAVQPASHDSRLLGIGIRSVTLAH